MNNNKLNIGDVVKFNSKKGPVEGVITQFKVKTPGKRKLDQMGLGHFATMHETAVVSMPGSTSFWTVPIRMLTFVSSGSVKQVIEAEKVVSNVKYAQQNAKLQRLHNRVDKIFEIGLDKLNCGDKIKIRFKDRYMGTMIRECTYLGQTSSRRLRIIPADGYGREMSVTPNCVVV